MRARRRPSQPAIQLTRIFERPVFRSSLLAQDAEKSKHLAHNSEAEDAKIALLMNEAANAVRTNCPRRDHPRQSIQSVREVDRIRHADNNEGRHRNVPPAQFKVTSNAWQEQIRDPQQIFQYPGGSQTKDDLEQQLRAGPHSLSSDAASYPPPGCP